MAKKFTLTDDDLRRIEYQKIESDCKKAGLKRIPLTEEQIDKIITDKIRVYRINENYRRSLLHESGLGLLHGENGEIVVEFDPSTNILIDSVDLNRPGVYRSRLGKYEVISSYRRNENYPDNWGEFVDKPKDLNSIGPKTIKGKEGYRFLSPKDRDLMISYAVYSLQSANIGFDTIIKTPSSSNLNLEMYDLIKRWLNIPYGFTGIIEKKTASEILNEFINSEFYATYSPGSQQSSPKHSVTVSLYKTIDNMVKRGDNLNLRKSVQESVAIFLMCLS